MNTPDTEWEKEKFNELLTLVKRGHEAVINEEEIEEYYGELRTFITSLRTSRDTYWKERVREFRPILLDLDVIGNPPISRAEYTEMIDEALDTLLDNLK